MRFIFSIVILMAAMFVLLSVVRGFFGVTSEKTQSRPSRRSTTGGRLVKDPVCGTYIPAATAIQAHDQFFCSDECRGKFVRAN